MENKTKKNTGFIILSIIELIIIIGLIVLFMYNNKNNSNNTNKEIKTNKVETKESSKLKEGEDNNSIEGKYTSFLSNLKDKRSNKFNLTNKEGFRENITSPVINYSVYLNPNGELYIQSSSDEFLGKYGNQYSNDTKIADKVVFFKNTPTGQGGYYALSYVDENGDLYRVNVGTASTLTPNKLDYKYIVNISSAVKGDGTVYTNETVYTDIDGNVYGTNLDN